MRWTIGWVLFGVFVLVMTNPGENRAHTGEDHGPAELTLTMEKKEPVPFPHAKHQEVLNHNCKTCHDLFPQESGGIERLKSETVLKPKQVMNKHCIKCHKARKKEGLSSGPTSCKTCHVKN